jgi:hypothetical protein
LYHRTLTYKDEKMKGNNRPSPIKKRTFFALRWVLGWGTNQWATVWLPLLYDNWAVYWPG